MSRRAHLRPGPLRLLTLLDRLLQRLVPADERRVAWVSDPDYIGNAFHLFRHTVATREDLEHVWLVADDAVRARIESDFAAFGGPDRGHRLRVVRRHGLSGYLAMLRSGATFHTHGIYPWVTTARGRHVVSLWHGMPIKAIGALNTVSPNPHPTFGTLHLATSDFYREIIAAAFRVPVGDVVETGLPRCDVLHRPHPLAPDAAAVRAALDVPAGSRLVLWLPTYRAEPQGREVSHDRVGTPGTRAVSSFLDDLTERAWDRVDQLAGRAGATVLVKLHPADRLNQQDVDLGRAHVRVMRSAEWSSTGMELYDVLAVSDGLISDLSSVLVDWLPTGRPMGMVGFDPRTYPRDVLVPVSALEDSPRVHALADEVAMRHFFDLVAEGARLPPEDDDLSDWLYPPRHTDGCERVLGSVGL